MFGLNFIKTQPTHYVIAFRGGRPVREGPGLSIVYFVPTTALVVVPTGSISEAFMFEETTADFQAVTIQGQLVYRIAEPRRTAELLDFSVDNRGRHVSEDPQKLSQRLIDKARVAVMTEVRTMALTDTLVRGDRLVAQATEALRGDGMVAALGVEVLGLSILAVRPKPETARALEAEVREALLRRADEATYARRNAAVDQERAIKENELQTEIAIEHKRRQVKEAQMEADRAVRERRRQIEREELDGEVAQEERRSDLVGLAAANARQEADTKAYAIDAVMKAFSAADTRVLQALTSVGLEPGQLMAMAFREIAGNADKIGQLNISPDLLREIMGKEDARHGR
ncbi:MAG: SPFH domain-containing protein [Azospirillum sp.]|nr:SPFH domain-containing protein [Azospirillum sp.]